MNARIILSLAILGALTPLARAADMPSQIGQEYASKVNSGLVAPSLSLDPLKQRAEAKAAETPYGANATDSPVLTLDAGGTASRIHGFGDLRINTQYITPRGLVAVESSPQFQTLFGLVFDIYHGDGPINGFSLVGGIWSDLNPHPDKSVVTGADIVSEVDVFGGFSVKFLKNWEFAYTIQAWTFPDLSADAEEINPTTEYNMDFKLSYDDTEILHEFALHPYVDFFWNFAGKSSPVVADALLGKNDHTFYVELGIAPSYTWKASADYPITFTMPTYFTMGDSSFWGETPSGDRSNFGVVSTGLKISMPLAFIPKDFGNWSTYVGVTYIHTCNPALTFINSGTGADSNLVLGYAGIGFGF